MTMGVSELQKNISIIRNLRETLYVIDKKTNETLATILPNRQRPTRENLTDELAGSLSGQHLPEHYHGDLDAAIDDAWGQAMREKYGAADAS